MYHTDSMRVRANVSPLDLDTEPWPENNATQMHQSVSPSPVGSPGVLFPEIF